MAHLLAKKYETKPGHSADRQLRALFDYSIDYKICTLDTAGRVVGWSKSAERLTGYTSRDIVGMDYSFLMPKAERHDSTMEKILFVVSEKGQFNGEGIRTRKDGTHYYARTCITSLKGSDGAIRGFVVITRNITADRERAQQRDAYIGIASHELRNPLTTLSLYSDLLQKGLELDGSKKNLQMLRDIQLQTNRLVELVDDLLLVSKIEGGTLELHKEIFDPSVFVSQIIKAFQKGISSHQIEWKPKPMGHVNADRDRITQVLVNLLTNAIKYSPQTNRIIVRIARLKKECAVSVQNFGPSITARDQKEIFSRFFRTAGAETGTIAGAGLGLYISKEIMKRHKQRLWVESSKGKGTTFYFTLPLAQRRLRKNAS
jgi:PAS domain S-box-containing protein